MKQVVAQHCRLAVPAGSLFLERLRAAAYLVHLHRNLLRTLGDGFDLLIHRRDRIAGCIVLGAGKLQLGIQLPQHLTGMLNGMQPKADLQPLLFPGIRQEFFGLFRLLLQRADPLLQFPKDVAQAQQVVFSGAQPAFRLVFAVAVFGDSRRFLKYFPAILRFGGHNIADPALADNGVAVPAEAGIHE